MLFVNQSLEPESEADKNKIQELAERPFSEWMEHRKLSPKLQDIILYGVLFIRDPNDPRFTTSAAISLLRRYVRSIGRYGESPFIYPIYGCSELPQAYSRSALSFIIIKKKKKSLIVIKKKIVSNPWRHVCAEKGHWGDRN